MVGGDRRNFLPLVSRIRAVMSSRYVHVHAVSGSFPLIELRQSRTVIEYSLHEMAASFQAVLGHKQAAAALMTNALRARCGLPKHLKKRPAL